jgi:hypothetical protein
MERPTQGLPVTEQPPEPPVAPPLEPTLPSGMDIEFNPWAATEAPPVMAGGGVPPGGYSGPGGIFPLENVYTQPTPTTTPPSQAPPVMAGGGVPPGGYTGPGGIFPLGTPATAMPPTSQTDLRAPALGPWNVPSAPPTTVAPYTAPSTQQPPVTPSVVPGGVDRGLGTGIAAPIDTSYFTGGGAPTLAQIGMNILAPPQQAVAQNNPQVLKIASMYGVDLATALTILQTMLATGQPIPAMQYGGSPQAGQSVLVGERGPEVFTPDVPGTIAPMEQNLGLSDILTRKNLSTFHPLDPERNYPPAVPSPQRLNPKALEKPYFDPGPVRFSQAAWDAWVEGLPESKNVEDRRQEHSPEELLRIMGYRKEWK